MSSGRALKNVEKNRETHVIENLVSRRSQAQGGGTYGLARVLCGRELFNITQQCRPRIKTALQKVMMDIEYLTNKACRSASIPMANAAGSFVCGGWWWGKLAPPPFVGGFPAL